MFLRSNHRKKDGKDHRYFSIVENHRIAPDKTVQRTVLYLGEINDQPQATWRKTLSVFDDEQQEYANLSLFPDDREIPADAVDSLQVKLSGLELRRPRLFGSCWLGCQLWQPLGLDQFWDAGLSGSREDVPWESVSGPRAETQARTLSMAAPEVGRSVSNGIRSAALRPDP